MRCALVFYFVVTIFVVVYGLSELCLFEDNYGGKRALCGKYNVEHTFDFIPPVYQNISYINLQGQPLKQLPYNAFRNLSSQSSISEISLTLCQISHVDAGALLNLNNLTTISLSLNNIKQIDSKLFSHTKHIKRIFMQYNKIEVLPNGIFQNLPLLEIVYLEHNRLRQLERYSFTNTPSLDTINLNFNQIESMNMLFKDKFDNLKTLWLGGNPWKCNCELGPLYEFIIKTNQVYQYGLVCENPPALHGRNWSDISRDEFVCRSKDTLSTQDTVMTSTEATTTTEQDDTIPVTTVKRTSDRRTNARNMDSGLPMRAVQSSAVSGNSDSASNMADVDEKQTSIHHYGLREATRN